MNFDEYLKINAILVDKKLEMILKTYAESFGKNNPVLGEKFQEFINASRGGKRLRGVLVLLGYKIAGGANVKKVLDAAAALEIFQTAILAQDDFIDKSKTRRDKPSLHQALGGDHKAISEAVCLSDLGFFISFKLLGNSGAKVFEVFSQSLMDTVLGEMLDIDLLYGESSEQDSLKIAMLKTASYSFSAPLVIGAILGAGDKGLLQKLEKFGTNAGIAYQIQDDVLGVFGEEKILGKSTDSDIKEGKVTLMITQALKFANTGDRKILQSIYGKKSVTREEKNILKSLLVKLGAFDYAKSRTSEYFKKARTSLNGINEPLLYSLMDFLKERES
jgi:geranylgeranyl pyrophosphate synthase